MKQFLITVLSLLLLSGLGFEAHAQKSKDTKTARTSVRSGNRAYKAKRYSDAATQYQKAAKADSNHYRSHYNLGNALYRKENFDSAAHCYQKALRNKSLTHKERSQAYHNLGNAQLRQGMKNRNDQGGGMEQFQQAVKNYQEALKIDPKNNNTRYNLSYAQKLLAQAQNQQKKNGGGQGGGQGQQQNKQGQKQQGQGQNQQGKDKNKQGQQNNDQQNKDQQKKQPPKPTNPKNDKQKEDAERLLNAVRNNERNTLRNQQHRQESKVDARIEKDW